MMTRAAISIRVSTQKQADRGYGLGAQLTNCLAYIERRGYEIDEDDIYTDVITGTTSDRPGLNALIEDIPAKGIEVVVIPEIKREARDYAEFIEIEDRFKATGVRLEYADGMNFDPNNKYAWMGKHMAAMFAHIDREDIKERTIDGIKRKVASGQVFASRAPYGYRLAVRIEEKGKRYNTFEIDEDEAATVVMIYTWYTIGDQGEQPLSAYAITRRLAQMGIPTRADNPDTKLGRIKTVRGHAEWSERIVRVILRREYYTGVWYWGKTKNVKWKDLPKDKQDELRPRHRTHPDPDDVIQMAVPREQWKAVTIPAIIDRTTWELAQQRAAENKQRASRNASYDYLFSSRLTCRICNKVLIGHTSRATRNRKRDYHYYRHDRHRPACYHTSIGEADLDRALWTWICEVAGDPDDVEQRLAARQDEAEQRNAPLRRRIAIHEKHINELTDELDELQLQLVQRRVTPKFFDQRKPVVEKQLADHERRHGELLAQLETAPHSESQIRSAREVCAAIQLLAEPGRARRHERKWAYDLLQVVAEIDIEDGQKVAYASCILDARRLALSDMSPSSHVTQYHPIRLSARLVIGPVCRRLT